MGPIVVMKALMMGKELGDLSTIEEEASVEAVRKLEFRQEGMI